MARGPRFKSDGPWNSLSLRVPRSATNVGQSIGGANSMSDQSKSHWLDDPATPKRMWTIFAIVLVLLVVAELFVTHHHKGFMFNFGFSAWFGFLVGGVSIVLSKGWKKILKRKDTYYDE